ncbi:hypothetical protein [Sphingopyxis sp. MWB1]|uniref:hypothetical protein n=1 Tax=Sphingopyxis sp. MWB1 TaxID=1537715 RepID=UPI00068B07E0|nr:hypothetical protein [Sphingopyxis sp. MWB1]
MFKYMPISKSLLTLALFLGGAAHASACEVRLSDTEIDYGALNRGEIATGRPGTSIALGQKRLSLSISCAQPAPMGLRLDGDLAEADKLRFGPSGLFSLRLSNAMVDGVPVSLTRKGGGNTADLSGAAVMLSPGQTVFAIQSGRRVVGKLLSATIEIDASIDGDLSRVRDATQIEGRATLSHSSE